MISVTGLGYEMLMAYKNYPGVNQVLKKSAFSSNEENKQRVESVITMEIRQQGEYYLKVERNNLQCRTLSSGSIMIRLI